MSYYIAYMQDMKAFKDTKEVPHQNADWDIFKCNFFLDGPFVYTC